MIILIIKVYVTRDSLTMLTAPFCHFFSKSWDREINIHTWSHPESTYALRVGGWVKPKVYSYVQGGWDGKAQSICTIQSLKKVRTIVGKNGQYIS